MNQKATVDAGDHLFQSKEHQTQVSQLQSVNQRAIVSVDEHSFQKMEVCCAAINRKFDMAYTLL